jgi:hypothetical protein
MDNHALLRSGGGQLFQNLHANRRHPQNATVIRLGSCLARVERNLVEFLPTPNDPCDVHRFIRNEIQNDIVPESVYEFRPKPVSINTTGRHCTARLWELREQFYGCLNCVKETQRSVNVAFRDVMRMPGDVVDR